MEARCSKEEPEVNVGVLELGVILIGLLFMAAVLVGLGLVMAMMVRALRARNQPS